MYLNCDELFYKERNRFFPKFTKVRNLVTLFHLRKILKTIFKHLSAAVLVKAIPMSDNIAILHKM